MDTTRWMRHKEINLMSKNNFKTFLDTFLSSAECKIKGRAHDSASSRENYPDISDDLSSKSHLHNANSNAIDQL